MERLLIKLSILFVAVALIQMHGYRCCLEKERIALLEIKAFFKSISSHETDTILVSWVNDKMSNCCGWEEVKCNATTERVVKLSLRGPFNYGNSTNGYAALNLSLFYPLEELQSLDLSENSFRDWYKNKADDSFGSLKQLKILNLGFNNFNASVLPYLTALTSLETLILEGNRLGHFKAKQGLENLTKLEMLDLSDNGISTSLTESGIANLRALKMLDLSGNDLNGSLASQGICELKNLVELDLGWNNIDGQLPLCLINLTYLKVLDLSSNQLSGDLPPHVIATLTSLEYLSLSDNNFRGIFSFSLLANTSKLQVFQLSTRNDTLQVETEDVLWLPTFQLKVLNLHNCKLSGTIPSFLLHQYNLRYIDLSHNRLVGMFPTWLLQNNTKLEVMRLINNSFAGTLQLPNFKHDLLQLDISINNFRGQLPKNIGTMLPKLVYMNMSDNSFEGNMPSSMGNLEGLKLLDLSRNNFSGEVPKQFLAGCSTLEFLKMSYNNFSGQVFPKYMNFSGVEWLLLDNNNFSGNIGDGLLNANTFLRVLDITNNKVSGQIPYWIGNFSKLKLLLMGKNLLEGNIPIELNNLKFLDVFDISENRLIGPMSSSFNLSSVIFLYMQKNALSGSIPNLLFQSSKLMILNLMDNKFFGSIPHWIHERSNLQVLLLRGNHLQGHIPNQLCQSRNLSILDLSHNKLNGSIPSCFTNMLFWMRGENDEGEDDEFHYRGIQAPQFSWSWHGLTLHNIGTYYNSTLDLRIFEDSYTVPLERRLEVKLLTKNRYDSYKGNILNYMTGIDLSSNNLSGDIPVDIGDLQKIRALNLSHNSLSGSIPKSFSRLEMIESLDLSFNKISGQIPQQLIELNYLSIFNVSYNNLSGPTPTQGQFANFDESNYGGNPNLCGPLIKKKCTSALLPSSPSNKEEHDEFAIDMMAFYWSFAGSYIIIISGLLVILWINRYWRKLWFYFIDACINSCYHWFSKYVS